MNWRLVVQKTRVKKKCFQFSSEGGERRCSPYGWRQTVPCPSSGDMIRPVPLNTLNCYDTGVVILQSDCGQCSSYLHIGFGSLLCASFIVLILTVGWEERNPTHKTIFHISAKILFQKTSWKKTKKNECQLDQLTVVHPQNGRKNGDAGYEHGAKPGSDFVPKLGYLLGLRQPPAFQRGSVA